MRISKIAVGVDLSPLSEKAAQEALALARRVGASLTLLHVAPIPDPLPASAAPAELSGARKYREILLARLAESRDKLGQLCQRLSGQGVEVSKSVIDNNFPDQSLASAASELKADLLVVGTAGRTGLEHMVIGSTAEGTVRRSSVPTLVARANHEPLGRYQKILVPTDFSPASKRAIEFAAAVADRGARIDVFHALEADGEPPMLLDLLATEAHQRAHDLFTQQTRDDVNFHFSTDNGSARAAIQKRGASSDLIVMGSHGRRGFAHLFLGSVAEYTVRHAPCSVLTVHAPEHA